MAFNHGVRTSETATSLVATKTDAITPFYVGTAPINMCEKQNINTPILCSSYEEAVKEFGFVNDFENYTLCEAIDAHFNKFGVGPIVLVNVLDPAKHKKSAQNENVPFLENKTAVIRETGIIVSSLKITPTITYTTEFTAEGYLMIIQTGEEEVSGNKLSVTYDKLDPSTIKNTDIVGGIDPSTGKKKGLECVSTVFPKYRLVPNLILAPKWSTDSTVAAVMETKANLINGHFKGFALIDIDTKTVTKYSDATKHKNDNNLVSTYLDVCYPKVKFGDTQYHLSTQRACLIQSLAAENDGIPYKSPSNENIKADSTCLADGTEVFLGLDEANYLNGNGITTAINWIGGWKAWGNRTGCYPDVTDPKDNFVSSRLMFNFLTNSLVQTYWQKVDDPTNKNLITTITDSVNIWLNGLQAAGKLIGGRVEFREEDNPTTSLINGQIKFKIFFSPALPAEDISFDLEIDTTYYNNLF